MLTPFVEVMLMAINLLEMALFAWIILGLLIYFDIINAHQPFIAKVRFTLDRIFNPILRPIRELMPNLGGLDLSPIALILLLHFIKSALIHWL